MESHEAHRLVPMAVSHLPFCWVHCQDPSMHSPMKPGRHPSPTPLASPYDTLEEVIGVRGTPGSGSLAEHGVGYRVLPLAPGSGAIDWGALATAVKPGGNL